VRITLDYYRILNVSIKADLDRLNQAYQDRLQQQPRREYSSNAIANRQKIIEQAYAILSDPDKRAEYDNNFFDPEKAESFATQNSNPESDLLELSAIAQKEIAIDPYIEIEPNLLVGTLMILHELAEYEVVLRLGNEYLQELEQTRSYQSSYYSGSNTTTQISVITEQKPDVLLCLALSYLDLSREQWQREEFENAAISGNLGIKLLQQDSLFLRLQKEIEAELNLLKPYRILELLEQNPPGSSLRVRGLQLLQEMLQQREGIEGKSNDISGLKSDQFLHFIQQIRTYLTLQEQKELFLAETKRGSHPGSCLAAYALIAEGYTQKKPSSILQAQKILQNLSQSKQSPSYQSYSAKLQSQNTHWERAMCALLLGQTVESQAIIQQSEDTKTLNLIKQYSSESPDLLPGLCFYGQQWLQKKVLAQFKDLQSSQMSLGDYYNDPAVQLFIENISPITDRVRQDRPSVAFQPASMGNAEQTSIDNTNKETNKSHSVFPWRNHKKATNQTTSLPTASYNPNSSPVKTATTSSSFVTVGSQNREFSPTLPNNNYQSSTVSGKTTNPVTAAAISFPIERDRVAFTQSSQTKRQKSKKSVSRKYWKSGLFLLALIGGIGTLGFVLTRWGLETSSQKSVVSESVNPPEKSPSARSDSSAIAKTATPVETKPKPKATPKATVKPSTVEVFNQALAQKLVQKWLDSKAAALGQKHQVDRLDSILTGSLLTQWRDTSKYYQQNQIYRQFEHQINIRSYQVNPQNANKATVETEVNEIAQHYQKGQVDRSQSYGDRLIVRYELVRQKDSWLIESSKVVQSL
jgi:curved DNA-binding protein CbpA